MDRIVQDISIRTEYLNSLSDCWPLGLYSVTDSLALHSTWYGYNRPYPPGATCTVNCARKGMTFVNTTAIAYYQNHEAPADFLPVCNSSCVHAFASRLLFAPIISSSFIITQNPPTHTHHRLETPSSHIPLLILRDRTTCARSIWPYRDHSQCGGWQDYTILG